MDILANTAETLNTSKKTATEKQTNQPNQNTSHKLSQGCAVEGQNKPSVTKIYINTIMFLHK